MKTLKNTSKNTLKNAPQDSQNTSQNILQGNILQENIWQDSQNTTQNKTPQNTRKNTRKKGSKYEEIALQYLVSLGFTLIEKNFYTQYGEIDLIMQKGETLHFIEVKSSLKSHSSFNPIYNITKRKLERLSRAIEIFMVRLDLDMDFCIDSVSIYNDKISFVENVTI